MIDLIIAGIGGVACALFLIGPMTQGDKEAIRTNARRVAREDRQEWVRLGQEIKRFYGNLKKRMH